MRNKPKKTHGARSAPPKKTKMLKRANVYSIWKFIEKKAKMHFQFENLYKKGKNKKKESTFFGIFLFLYPLSLFFCIFNLKIYTKKDKNAKKTWLTFENAL